MARQRQDRSKKSTKRQARPRAKKPREQPVGKSANTKLTGTGPSHLEHLRHQLAEWQRYRPPSQVAIILEDDGERCSWVGADENDWKREPWRAVVWIGPFKHTEVAIARVVQNELVIQALKAGARIEIDRRGNSDLDKQRQEAGEIGRRLSQTPPSAASPLSDQIIYHATRAVAEPENTENPITIPLPPSTPAPPAGSPLGKPTPPGRPESPNQRSGIMTLTQICSTLLLAGTRCEARQRAVKKTLGLLNSELYRLGRSRFQVSLERV
jgi:hypothetical protein